MTAAEKARKQAKRKAVKSEPHPADGLYEPSLAATVPHPSHEYAPPCRFCREVMRREPKVAPSYMHLDCLAALQRPAKRREGRER